MIASRTHNTNTLLVLNVTMRLMYYPAEMKTCNTPPHTHAANLVLLALPHITNSLPLTMSVLFEVMWHKPSNFMVRNFFCG
jgi:hypothetical protein